MATCLRFAQLAADGNGTIGESELAEFDKMTKRLAADALSFVVILPPSVSASEYHPEVGTAIFNVKLSWQLINVNLLNSVLLWQENFGA